MTDYSNDLRLLRTAAVLEVAFERFALEVARTMIQDHDLRKGLERIVDPADRHYERIIDATRRLTSQLSADDHLALARAAVLSVRDTERMARSFYESHAKEARDPAVRALFEELAREENGHVAAAEAVVDRMKPAADPPSLDQHPFMPDLQYLHDLETLGVGH